MTVFIALLRAVNVGGTGKLPMAELKTICESAGFERVRTYIASGNVVFESPRSEADVKSAMEASLAGRCGKPVGVFIRTAAEIAAILASNPFPKAPPNHIVAIFLDEVPSADALESVHYQSDEELGIGRRGIFVYYPHGMGKSKLKIPAARRGTARNMNTVAKLAQMAAELVTR
jgi:uncharacterized protein (DUF1697 family)